ncbi:hypothetical protein BJ878DRAFT_431371, partial [Calycina marina]
PHLVSTTLTSLSKYLRDALLCTEHAKEQYFSTPLARTMITAMSVMLRKIERAPNYNTIMQALTHNDSERHSN